MVPVHAGCGAERGGRASTSTAARARPSSTWGWGTCQPATATTHEASNGKQQTAACRCRGRSRPPTTSSPMAQRSTPLRSRIAALDFSLGGVSPATAGNTGQVTLMIAGTAIPTTTTVSLVHPVEATSRLLPNIGSTPTASPRHLTSPAWHRTPWTSRSPRRHGATLINALIIEAGGGPDFWWRSMDRI